MEKVINEILDKKVIVILRGVARDELIPLAEALYEGGIRLMEITYNANGTPSDAETAENIRLLAEHFDGRMLIGAGTVIRREQVELTRAAGGKFIISPDTDPEIIKYTKELGLVSIPGALTPSEITLANRSGADFIKLFPISSLGTKYVKAIRAPLSHVRMLAVGGVNVDNMSEYFNAGICGIGAGYKNIADAELFEKRDYAAITEKVKSFLEVVYSAK